MRLILIISVIFALKACATNPDIPLNSKEQILVGDLVHHAQCEIQLLYKNLNASNISTQNWKAKFELSLDLEHSSGSGSMLGAIVTLAQISTPVIPFLGGASSKGMSRSITLKYKASFNDVAGLKCNGVQKDKQITGSLGLLEAFKSGNQANSQNFDSFTHRLAFQIKREFTPRLAFEIKTIDGQANFSSSTRKGHIITFAMVKEQNKTADTKLETLLNQQLLRNLAK